MTIEYCIRVSMCVLSRMSESCDVGVSLASAIRLSSPDPISQKLELGNHTIVGTMATPSSEKEGGTYSSIVSQSRNARGKSSIGCEVMWRESGAWWPSFREEVVSVFPDSQFSTSEGRVVNEKLGQKRQASALT